MLTTPYDIAYNRMKETLITKHGSCGMGVGATMKRHIETPFKLFAQDLLFNAGLRQKLINIKGYYIRMMSDRELVLFKKILEEDNLETIFLGDVCSPQWAWPFQISDVDVNKYHDVVFEGSQGIMLDMDHGIFPNVTYANTTIKNAVKFCNERKIRLNDIHYVTRCYTTRHGEGWMPNEGSIELINTEEEINVTNEWQGGFRLGEIDYDMLRNALAVDENYHPQYQVKKHLKIACLDQRPDFEFLVQKLKRDFNTILGGYSAVRGNYKEIA